MQEDVIKDYENNVEINEILEKYGITFSTFYNIVSPTLRHSMDSVTDFERSQVCELYLGGLSTTKIGVQLRMYHKLVSKILGENNIDRINNGKRKWKLNELYFDKIDTPNKAYILGLLYADGYNSLDKSTVSISLEKTDRDILEKIRLELESEKPLEFIRCEDKVASNGYVSHNMYRLVFFSSHICKMLDRYGVHQNKSLILEFPFWLDYDLVSHFARGYFDGDGSYCHHKTSRRISKMAYYQDLVTFTSTFGFCNALLSFLRTNNIVQGGGVYEASNHNGITAVLSISGRKQISSLFDWMYQDAELYMTRKFEKLTLGLAT